jgi:multicomponent Na+:H+ antiporter subunit D
MAMGAVLFRTGTCKGSDLGNLFRSMPLTMAFCVVGAASVSAFPLFSGFVSKSLIVSASGKEGYWLVWCALLLASLGAFHQSVFRICYSVFFARDRGMRPKEAPTNMLLAMGAAAVLCVGIGVWPEPLYALLPYDVDYAPYTASHVITQLQLLAFAALSFTVLMLYRIYPPELKSTNLDFDWVYRRLLPRGLIAVGRAIDTGYKHVTDDAKTVIRAAMSLSASVFAPGGLYGRTFGVGNAVAIIAFLLLVALMVSYSAV